MTPEQLFSYLWQDYASRLCPSAHKIKDLLQEERELINDHIALRTFNIEPLGLETLAAQFAKLGYQVGGKYHFEAKKLRARHYEHPNPDLPKVFISELLVEELSITAQKVIRSLVAQVDSHYFSEPDFLYAGRPWSLSIEQYHLLSEESEYAAWVAAHGYGANHFTVSVNQLNRFEQVKNVNQYLRQHDFAINESGGEVKGTPELMLEQSSTMADIVEVSLIETELRLPGGFYEFAKRYPTDSGVLYSGFVEASANKIFESTDRRL
ncbi:2-oxoadipate dioxygenase/decarboxylase family protein [Vibrio sp. WJH972]